MKGKLEIMKASAGSGKTYRLARKYIGLLLESQDRYAYRHILAVTFTNKATDEMKGRILKELHILSCTPENSDYYTCFVPHKFPSSEELQEKARVVLSDMLHDYSAFSVSTIDRFFQQTLKSFAREIGQFASYQVELDKDSLIAESVDRVLDSLTEADASLLSWLTDNVLEQIEQGGRYSMDANLLEMAGRLKSSQRQDVVERTGISADEEYSKEKLIGIRRECRRIVTDFRKEVVIRARKALDILEQAGVSPEESTRGFMKTLYAYAELTEYDKVDQLKPSFVSRALDSDQWFPKLKAGKLLPLVYPFLEAPLHDFCSLFGKEFKLYNTALILDEQLYGLGVAGELNRAFKELMREKNVLCIDDSNTILRDIIDGSDAPFVYEKLGVRYEHFLLDEFQDTSGVQWNNFSPLLGESDSNGNENLIVGDVKQSIYRWRGSDWRLLDVTVPGEFPGHEEEVLDTNYRSLFNVVQFNNCFFSAAAGILDGMCGNEDGQLGRIYSDVRQKVGKKVPEKGNVSLTFCSRDAELQKVLEAVIEAVASGAQLSDIAVLVRSNAIGEAVATFLIDNGIAVVTDDSLKVKNSMTVRRLVSLMSFIDNPLDTVNGYLASALEVSAPEDCTCLMDLAESLFRSLKENDREDAWKGEILHIQSFMDNLQDYVASNGNNLRGFLKYWEEENPSISSPSSGESVRVMTIHKSKGLDFPYVIVPFVENINMYKSDRYWCVPHLEGTSLEGVAEGVYDVTLSKASEDTLFAEDYVHERFLQMVDNINTLYVALTRAALGMHIIAKTPSAKCLKALDSGDLSQFTDFSQLLYWFASLSSRGCEIPGSEDLVAPFSVSCTVDDEQERFDIGTIIDFAGYRKPGPGGPEAFVMGFGDKYPSIPLNPSAGDASMDVRERGRLKFSADSLDFFSDGGQVGISASNRLMGVVLHNVLAQVRAPEDLGKAVEMAVASGDLTVDEAEEVRSLLDLRIGQVRDRGWFPSSEGDILNEVSLIDSDGKIYRPDRVVRRSSSVVIIDYKFGEHDRKYERQLKRYSDIWKKMGYADVSSYLWYIHTGDIMEV